jgi:peptidyl-prolyl cis-trans isomerase NIMA-interacting 1
MTQRLAIVACLFLAACSHAAPPPAATAASDPASQPSAAAGAPKPKPERIELRVLLVSFSGAAGAGSEATRTKDEARQRASTFAAMARQGDKLSELVPRYSDRVGAAEDRGLFQLHPASPAPFGDEVVAAALALPVGGISEPVETPQGYLVLERLRDPDAVPEQIAARHILIIYAGSPNPVPGATRSEAEARVLADQIAAEAQQVGADFGVLAAKYTEEPGGKERGGSLGMFGRGQMVPAFEQVAFKLKVGQVSGVVPSPFGFHVIQRTQ